MTDARSGLHEALRASLEEAVALQFSAVSLAVSYEMCVMQIRVNVGSLRFFHVNVNCSDLERSLGFYGDLVGLKAAVRTRPEQPQPGGAFGLAQVQWDAWIMAGDDAPDGVVLDLLERKVPLPSGSPPASLTELGFGRLCILSDDLAGLHRRLSEAGHDVWSPPGRLGLGVKDMVDAEMFLCSDPDGIAVLFVQGEDTRLASVKHQLF